MGSILSTARLDSFVGPPNAGFGVYLSAVKPVLVGNIGFTLTDESGNFYTNPGYIALCRFAVVLGKFFDDPANFTNAYDLTPYRVLMDFDTPNLGAFLAYSSDQTPIKSDPGQGLSFLLSTPVLYPGPIPGVSFVPKIFGAAGAARSSLVPTIPGAGVGAPGGGASGVASAPAGPPASGPPSGGSGHAGGVHGVGGPTPL